jgi:hypothetical protein
MDDAWPIFVFAPPFIAAVVFRIAQAARTSALPQRGALGNGLRLRNCDRKTFVGGPLFFPNKADKVLRITVMS